MTGNNIFKEAAVMLLLVILVFCVYSNSLNGEFVFDDVMFYANPNVELQSLSFKDLSSAARKMQPATRPVANVSFALNYYFHEFDVRGYHVVNILIHILTSIFLYLFCKTTLNLPGVKKDHAAAAWVPFAAAAIWAVHPLQTQAVSYIVQRMTSLSALFYILSMLLYVRARLSVGIIRKSIFFGGCILSGLLSLGSKEIAATLLFFILLYEWFFLQDLDRAWIRSKWKYWVGLFAFLLIITFVFLGGNPFQSIGDSYRLVHELNFRDFTLQERVLTEFRVMFFYLSLLVFPHPARLCLEHDFPLSTSLVQPLTTGLAIVAVLALVLTAVKGAFRYRLASFGVLWFLGNHLIEGSVLPLEVVFEHRNYLPSMLLVLVFVVTLDRIVSRKRIVAGILCLLVACFSYWTYQRNFVWQSRVNLWRDCVEKVPEKPRPHNNLGVALKAAGMFDEAILHYKEAVRIDPGYVEAYVNLGNIMMKTGRYDEAARYYLAGAKILPNHVDLNLRLAHALFDSGELRKARIVYQRVLRLDPDNVGARINLSRLNNIQGTE